MYRCFLTLMAPWEWVDGLPLLSIVESRPIAARERLGEEIEPNRFWVYRSWGDFGVISEPRLVLHDAIENATQLMHAWVDR